MRFLFALLLPCLAVAPGHSALPPLAYVGSLKGEITASYVAAAQLDARRVASLQRELNRPSSLSPARASSCAPLCRPMKTPGLVTWKIDDARVQLGTWFAGLAKRYTPSVGSVTASGELIISGEGNLNDLKPTGSLHVHCPGITARDSAQGWTLDGITFDGDFELGPDFALKSTTPFSFAIRTITTSRLGARAFSLTGHLESLASVVIDSARIEIAGGEVASGRFTLPLPPLSVETRVQIKRIGLQDFAQLFPSGLADARGRLDGDLSLGWSPASGFKIGIGRIKLDEFEPTSIRLAASPGFLTSRIPARFEFLPGALGRWLSIRNDVYDDLQNIELGRTDLIIKSLQLALTPDGDSEGRSARVIFDASPADQTGAVKQVIFNINIAGPLSQLLNLGMSDTTLS
ncbi:MAG: YdbH domain-containing protein, partial [Nibricoccus sp.]